MRRENRIDILLVEFDEQLKQRQKEENRQANIRWKEKKAARKQTEEKLLKSKKYKELFSFWIKNDVNDFLDEWESTVALIVLVFLLVFLVFISDPVISLFSEHVDLGDSLTVSLIFAVTLAIFVFSIVVVIVYLMYVIFAKIIDSIKIRYLLQRKLKIQEDIDKDKIVLLALIKEKGMDCKHVLERLDIREQSVVRIDYMSYLITGLAIAIALFEVFKDNVTDILALISTDGFDVSRYQNTATLFFFILFFGVFIYVPLLAYFENRNGKLIRQYAILLLEDALCCGELEDATDCGEK